MNSRSKARKGPALWSRGLLLPVRSARAAGSIYGRSGSLLREGTRPSEQAKDGTRPQPDPRRDCSTRPPAERPRPGQFLGNSPSHVIADNPCRKHVSRPIQSGPICTRVRPFGRLTPDSGSLTPNPQRRFRSAMLSQEHEFIAHPISGDRRASQLCGGVDDMRGRIHFSHLWSNTFSQIIFSAPS